MSPDDAVAELLATAGDRLLRFAYAVALGLLRQMRRD
jgi:hypothetical protein